MLVDSGSYVWSWCIANTMHTGRAFHGWRSSFILWSSTEWFRRWNVVMGEWGMFLQQGIAMPCTSLLMVLFGTVTAVRFLKEKRQECVVAWNKPRASLAAVKREEQTLSFEKRDGNLRNYTQQVSTSSINTIQDRSKNFNYLLTCGRELQLLQIKTIACDSISFWGLWDSLPFRQSSVHTKEMEGSSTKKN